MDNLKVKEPKNNKFDFLGLNFSNVSENEAIGELERFIESRKPHMVLTQSVELVVQANENENLKNIYNNADLLTMDSYGVCYAAKLLRKPAKEPVNASRLTFAFLPVIHKRGYRLFLLGAKEDIVMEAAESLNSTYPGINIVGYHHGYFDFENDDDVVDKIKVASPDVLLVAMTSPLKEKFINKNLNKMNVPVSIAVGGCFDVIAGKCKLAPLWVSKISMEWLYRFIQEPKRLWKRYLTTHSKFIWLVLKEFFGNGKEKSKT